MSYLWHGSLRWAAEVGRVGRKEISVPADKLAKLGGWQG